jgi:hypothetical protein
MGEPTAPSGDSLISSASQSGDPNPFVLLGTLLFALAAAAGGALRGDPSLFRKLTRSLHGARHHGLKGPHGHDSTTTRTADEAPHQTSPSLTSFDTFGDLSPVTYPDVASADALHGYAGGPNSPSGLDDLAKAASNSAGSDGYSASHLGSADPGLGQQLGGQAGDPGLGHHAGQASGHGGPFQASAHGGAAQPDALGQAGGSLQPDALGHHGSGLSDWHTGGPSGSETVAQGPSGGSLGGGQAGGSLAHGPAGSGSDLAHSGFGGGSGNGLGGASGSDALAQSAGGSGDLLAHGTGGASPLAGHEGLISSETLGQLGGGHGAGLGGADLGSSHGVAQSGFGNSGLGGSHGPAGDGALAHHDPAPSGDLASQPPTFGGADGLTQADLGSSPNLAFGHEMLAQTVTTPDSPPPADSATLSASEPLDTSAADPGPSWLGIGALAKAGAPIPLPRVVNCTGCGRVSSNPSRFCGYCGEPFDKTLT